MVRHFPHGTTHCYMWFCRVFSLCLSTSPPLWSPQASGPTTRSTSPVRIYPHSLPKWVLKFSSYALTLFLLKTSGTPGGRRGLSGVSWLRQVARSQQLRGIQLRPPNLPPPPHSSGNAANIPVLTALEKIMEAMASADISRLLSKRITVGSNSIFVHIYMDKASGRLHDAFLSKLLAAFFGSLPFLTQYLPTHLSRLLVCKTLLVKSTRVMITTIQLSIQLHGVTAVTQL